MTLHQISRKLVSRFFFLILLFVRWVRWWEVFLGSLLFDWVLLFRLFLICFVSLSFWVNVCVDVLFYFSCIYSCMYLLSFLSRRVSKDQPNNQTLHLILAELISVATIFRLYETFLILCSFISLENQRVKSMKDVS